MDKLFYETFTSTQEQLHKSMLLFLSKNYGVDNVFQDKTHKNFVCAKGNIPVTLLAHLDTVHKTSNKNSLMVDVQDRAAWSPDGLGADDRAGVYAILKIIQRGYRPNILFLHDEEVGGVGAKSFTHYDVPFVADSNFLIEFDRQGSEDAVYYKCGNKDFQTMIEGFGFKKAYGTYSDIADIGPFLDIASVNLSIGYYNAHTKNEYLMIPEMMETMNKACRILDWVQKPENIATKYDHQKEEYVYSNYSKKDGKYSGYSEYDDGGYYNVKDSAWWKKQDEKPSLYYGNKSYNYYFSHKDEFLWDKAISKYVWIGEKETTTAIVVIPETKVN